MLNIAFGLSAVIEKKILRGISVSDGAVET